MKKLIAIALAVSLATPAFATGYYPPVIPAPVVKKGVAPSASTPWVPFAIIGCAALLVGTAFAYRNTRELTSNEAWTCGTAAWFSGR